MNSKVKNKNRQTEHIGDGSRTPEPPHYFDHVLVIVVHLYVVFKVFRSPKISRIPEQQDSASYHLSVSLFLSLISVLNCLSCLHSHSIEHTVEHKIHFYLIYMTCHILNTLIIKEFWTVHSVFVIS